MHECEMTPEPETVDRDEWEAEAEPGDFGGFLSPEQLERRAANLPVEVVEVPGGKVRVRGLTADQAGRIAAMQERGTGNRVGASIVCWCVVGADGVRMFTDGDINRVMTWSNEFVLPIAKHVIKISGLEQEIDEVQGN